MEWKINVHKIDSGERRAERNLKIIHENRINESSFHKHNSKREQKKSRLKVVKHASFIILFLYRWLAFKIQSRKTTFILFVAEIFCIKSDFSCRKIIIFEHFQLNRFSLRSCVSHMLCAFLWLIKLEYFLSTNLQFF